VREREREKRDSSCATPQSVKKSYQRQAFSPARHAAPESCIFHLSNPIFSFLFWGDFLLVLCPPRLPFVMLDLIFFSLVLVFFWKKCGATRCAGKTIEEARTGGVGHVARWRCFGLLSSLMHGWGWGVDWTGLGWAVGIKPAYSVRAGQWLASLCPLARAWRLPRSRDGEKERATEGTSRCNRVPRYNTRTVTRNHFGVR